MDGLAVNCRLIPLIDKRDFELKVRTDQCNVLLTARETDGSFICFKLQKWLNLLGRLEQDLLEADGACQNIWQDPIRGYKSINCDFVQHEIVSVESWRIAWLILAGDASKVDLKVCVDRVLEGEGQVLNWFIDTPGRAFVLNRNRWRVSC